MSALLLDTCAALWLAGGEPMERAAIAAIDEAASDGSGVHVSPFTAWEIGTLVARGRVRLSLSPEVWFSALLARPGIRLAPLTPAILLASTSLPGNPPRDPADRIIAATARHHGWAIVTRDAELRVYAEEGHVMLLPC
ncbi:MAG: type II toxin-antitoxin system VapC family toxin [Acetobacteraceae bacterium]|nr:type II toxin-antitoxin system VapC family toxin [Acetobacteraceae bacterium]